MERYKERREWSENRKEKQAVQEKEDVEMKVDYREEQRGDMGGVQHFCLVKKNNLYQPDEICNLQQDTYLKKMLV